MPAFSSAEILLFVAAFALAIGISALLTPLVARWATSIGAVAAPRKDRWHSRPTPLLGGIAIYFGTTITILSLARIEPRMTGLLLGGAILFLTGLVDDRWRLRPHIKLIFQILAACVLIVSGVQVETASLAMIALPLTVVWVVGLTNAFNLLDNMDGLSSGTAAIAAFFLFAFSVSVGNAGTGIAALAVAGAALGFLIYNFNPARIFMGDSGSMFLGFTLSGVALMGTREMASDVFFVMLVPVAMMGLPIFDTTLVTIVRTLEGRPLSQGGRDHLSHRLVALGLSERQAVLLLYVLAVGFGLLGLVARSVGIWTSLAAAGLLLAVIVVFGAYLAQVRIYGPVEFAKAERGNNLVGRPIVNGMIMFKREIGLAALDFTLIFAAYLGAFLLRFGAQRGAIEEADLGAPFTALFTETLPIVVVVKFTALLLFHVYRGMWRYIGVSDLLSMAKVTISSTLVLFVLLPLLARGLVIPRSVLAIDWLLFTTFLVGSRVSFAALTDAFARLQNRRLPHILVVGAGDLGELVLRSLIRSHPAVYQAAGFLDPDPAMRSRAIHGVRVLGTTDDLERVVTEHDVDAVVLALPPARGDLSEQVRSQCESLGMPVYPAARFVEMHFAGNLALGPTENHSVTTPTSVN